MVFFTPFFGTFSEINAPFIATLPAPASRDLFESLISHMTSDPDQPQRARSHTLLSRLLKLADAPARMALLGDLVARCPFPNAKALLITPFKDAIAQVADSRGDGVQDAVDVILAAAEETLQNGAMDVLEKYDVIMTAISALVFLILRDGQIGAVRTFGFLTWLMHDLDWRPRKERSDPRRDRRAAKGPREYSVG